MDPTRIACTGSSSSAASRCTAGMDPTRIACTGSSSSAASRCTAGMDPARIVCTGSSSSAASRCTAGMDPARIVCTGSSSSAASRCTVAVPARMVWMGKASSADRCTAVVPARIVCTAAPPPPTLMLEVTRAAFCSAACSKLSLGSLTDTPPSRGVPATGPDACCNVWVVSCASRCIPSGELGL